MEKWVAIVPKFGRITVKIGEKSNIHLCFLERPQSEPGTSQFKLGRAIAFLFLEVQWLF